MERLKTGIDEVIGEKIWMTERLAKKMAEPRKKTSRTPIYAVVGFVAIAALFLTITLWSSQSDILSASTTKALGAHGELFNTYFEAIDAKDVETLKQVASPAHGVAIEELVSKYENIDFSKAEFLLQLDGIIWMKLVVINEDGEKWEDVVTYYQIVDGKIYEPVYEHPFYVYNQFDIEKAQAQAIFGFGGYRNNDELVAIEGGKLLVSGSRSYNKVESAIELYLKEIGEESVSAYYEQPRLVYKNNGKLLWLSADGFDIVFIRKGERILVDNQGVEYYQQGRF
ncbi:hypothetical protein [Psychrobacillus sp. NPDC096389]|uniref:hypothetical protein n=1 Tax=Psychrobacillus sp. NPDC096389 TaxID=3364490 RepID=UPI0037FA45B0